MKAKIIRIGNSRGIRIPKPALAASNLRDEVELEVRRGELVIRALPPPRAGWEDAFREMAGRADDALLDLGGTGSGWDETEWEW